MPSVHFLIAKKSLFYVTNKTCRHAIDLIRTFFCRIAGRILHWEARYDQLSEPGKENDLDTLRQILEILSRIEFPVYRRLQSNRLRYGVPVDN